jgi:DNA recombination protein RmuC
MSDSFMMILIALAVLQLGLIVYLLIKGKTTGSEKAVEELIRLQTLLKDEMERSRGEARTSARENREEASVQFKGINESLLLSLKAFDEKIVVTAREDRDELSRNLKTFNEEMKTSLKSFEDRFTGNVKEFNEVQKVKFDDLMNRHEVLKNETGTRLEDIRKAVESRLDAIQRDNNEKLEKMRATVDEKLHETLEKRLGESFKTVSEHLKAVHAGLGEMQNLAQGVGDLKRVLSNVKTRGILGEIQLGAILESILSPGQFVQNVATVKGSSERVDYAVRLPGKDDQDEPVLLPVDSKFPMDLYNKLMEAYDRADQESIEKSRKELYSSILASAKEIRKYISPPYTTDFAILFLPVEGLYSEIVRNHTLFEQLQKDHKIIVTGPTTLSALLSSLQMGFKTLAIEKRSSEVWKVLSAVKSEFEKFGETLDKARKKLSEANSNLDELVGTRTNKIKRTLINVEQMENPDDAPKLLNFGD